MSAGRTLALSTIIAGTVTLFVSALAAPGGSGPLPQRVLVHYALSVALWLGGLFALCMTERNR